MFELLLHRTAREERGASAVEYGLLIAGVCALIVLVVFGFGGVVTHLFSNSCGTITSKVQSANC